ncbi:MAG: outer membrane beta-barrel protein [Bacteroidaceae bacterium]|nr:outer membrane beta-barrel protein [Bacteroidaceae bacterium]
MKRFCIVLILALFASVSLFAQKDNRNAEQQYTLSFEEISLSDALKQLNDLSDKYRISFMYNELEDFRVSAKIVDKSIPEAVNQIVGLYPISVNIKEEADEVKIFVECIQKTDMRYKGRVLDSGNEPVAYANVVLFAPDDTAFVAGGITNEEGYFVIPCEKLPVLARFSFVGYETKWMTCRSLELGNIFMNPDGIALDDVTIEGHVPLYQMGDEGLMTNVENTPLSKLGSAEDVFKHVPGLVQRDGEYEVFGKGKPLVYVNGRKVYDMSELKQLSSADIKSIELITNPGAKYDASVNAVIRIRTVRKAGDGIGVDAMAKYDQGRYDNELSTLSLNYRKNGLDLFASAAASKTNTLFESDPMWQEVKADTLWRQSNYQLVHTIDRNIKLEGGFNYQFNDNHVMGAKYWSNVLNKSRSGDDLKFESEVTADGIFYDKWGNITKAVVERNYDNNANAYYIGKVGNLGIDLNVDYVGNKNTEHRDITETCQVSDDRTLSSDNIVENRMIASKLTLSAPVLGGMLDFGGEYINTDRDDDYINPENYVPTSYSTLKESTISPYLEYTRMTLLGQLRAGVRYEHVAFDYYANNVKVDEQSRRFDNFYPSASFATMVAGMGVQLSYSVKTTRPTYSQLSNNVSYANRFTMQTGNPLLNNSIRHIVSLAGGNEWLKFSLDYTNELDAIIYYAEQNTIDPKVVMINRKNIKSIKSFTPALILSPSFGVWRPQFIGGMYKQWLAFETIDGVQKMNAPIFSVQLNNTLVLRPDMIGEVKFVYQSPGDNQNIHMSYNVTGLDVAMTKTFFNDRLSIKVAGQDLLNRYKSGTLIRAPKIDIYQLNSTDSRCVSVTLRYRFNTTDSKYRGKGAGNEEKDRL